MFRTDRLSPREVESFGKPRCNLLPHEADIRRGSQESRHGRDAAVGNSAGDNVRKGPQIQADIQRKTVRRDALGDSYPDSGDFRRSIAADPHARQAFQAMAGNSPLSQRGDEKILQAADGRGKVEISFFNTQDLDRIYTLLMTRSIEV